MEDAATAEISRSQVWQWITHGTMLDDGRVVTRGLVEGVVQHELDTIRSMMGEGSDGERTTEAAELSARVALSGDFEDFLTIPACERLP
jgi:malate synthase